MGRLLVLVSAAAFGTLPIFARLAYAAGVAPVSLLALRFSIAALVLGGLTLRRARHGGMAWPTRRQLLALAALGGVGYVGQSLCYFLALSYVPAGLVALVFYLYPALVAILSALAQREPFCPQHGVALSLAAVGLVWTVGPSLSGRPIGLAFALLAATIYAIYIVAGARIMERVDAECGALAVILSAAAVYIGLARTAGATLPTTATAWLAIVGLSVISTVVAIVAFFMGLARIGATTTATLSTLEPVVTVVLAAIVLGEPMGPWQLGGSLLIVTSVMLLAQRKRAPAIPPTPLITLVGPSPLAVEAASPPAKAAASRQDERDTEPDLLPPGGWRRAPSEWARIDWPPTDPTGVRTPGERRA
jgi:drug/metabolite transporter (DMT)-like permease